VCVAIHCIAARESVGRTAATGTRLTGAGSAAGAGRCRAAAPHSASRPATRARAGRRGAGMAGSPEDGPDTTTAERAPARIV